MKKFIISSSMMFYDEKTTQKYINIILNSLVNINFNLNNEFLYTFGQCFVI